MSGRTAGWALLALAGIAVAVALSVAAGSLSTQPIGLSDEPLRAGDRLAPATRTVVKPAAKTKRKRKPARRRSPSTATTTTPAPVPVQTQTTVTPVPAPTVVTPTQTQTHTSTSDDGRREPGDDHGGTRTGSDD
jgi:hypothetical protein